MFASGVDGPTYLEDINDLTEWLSTPTEGSNGRQTGQPRPPAIYEWVDEIREAANWQAFESGMDALMS